MGSGASGDCWRIVPAVVEFLDDAVAKAVAARRWYEERSPVPVSLLETNCPVASLPLPTPLPRGPCTFGTRRYLMRRFPFFVVYRLFGETVQVVAVAHGRRRPGYWTAR